MKAGLKPRLYKPASTDRLCKVAGVGVVMELIEIAGVIALSVAVSLAGARAILTASLFLMMRGVAPVTAEVQQPGPQPTQTA